MLGRWVQTYIHDLHISSLDYGELLDELVAEVWGCSVSLAVGKL